jgi:hypothetical protein
MSKLLPPPNGVTIRMYRQGHGDCFLLAFPRNDGQDPVYVLIDCGFKPGSADKLSHPNTIEEIVTHLGDATGHHLDLAIITHEHQDHVNGIWKKSEPYFGDFRIDEAWMAWTEDPDDELANELRKRHKDQLLGLLDGREKLANLVGAADSAVQRLDSLIELELGPEEPPLLPALRVAATDPSRSVNKQAMKLIKDKANEGGEVRYLNPGDGPLKLEGTGVRVFVLGPPRDPDLIADEDPRGREAFPGDGHGLTFGAAASGAPGVCAAPFRYRYCLPIAQALDAPAGEQFFRDHYGTGPEGQNDGDRIEVPDNAEWRRIDSDWLFAAEQLALKLNTGINNTSLVLAFELPESKKVLLFVGDAQRGNWISWTDCSWIDGDETVTVRDLLARTVLYKVGHHASHNATLAGTPTDDYANLSWMATGQAGREFTAMITAVNKWALAQTPPWVHPLPSLRAALVKKAQGRVFQTDTDAIEKPTSVTAAAWRRFTERCTVDDKFFDYQILDE